MKTLYGPMFSDALLWAKKTSQGRYTSNGSFSEYYGLRSIGPLTK